MTALVGPLRILFAAPGYKPAYRIGGPIVSIARLAENLVRHGHRVVVFASNSNLDQDLSVPVNRPVMVDGVEVWYFEHREPLKRYLPFIPYFAQSLGYLYLPSLKRILHKRIREFDLAHTHMPFVYPTYAVAREAIRNGIPLFYQQRGAFAPAYLNYRGLKKGIYISLFEKPIMKSATCLIALTDADVASYRRLGVNTPCRIVPNGIDIENYTQSWDGELRVDDQFSIGPDDVVVLFLARLHAIKGADFLLEAFLQGSENIPNARLILAGPDQQNLGERLRERIGAAGAGKKALVAGMITGDLKRRLLARADLFCHPSIGEGFSMSILEALASGTAVLATPECNFPALEKALAGWIVEKHHQEWADKICHVLEDRAMLRRMGENGYNLVKQEFTWEKIVDELEHVYTQGVGSTRSGRGPLPMDGEVDRKCIRRCGRPERSTPH